MHEHSKPTKDTSVKHVELSNERKAELRQLADVLISFSMDQKTLNEKLVQFPGGYHVEEKGRCCILCQYPAYGKNSWYDKQGLKCMSCHQALAAEVFPPTVLDSPTTYYTREQLLYTFDVPASTLKSWIKKKIVTAREVLHYDNEKLHWQIFLLSDNPGFFPPHAMLNLGRAVMEEKEDGTHEFVFMPWYNYVNLKEYLKDYGIANFLP